MKSILTIALVLTFSLFLTGCSTPRAPFMPPIGYAYTGFKAPLDTHLGDTILGSKKGTSSASNYLGLIATGDASIQTAAENGGITTIHHVDYEYLNILFLFQEITVIVYGD